MAECTWHKEASGSAMTESDYQRAWNEQRKCLRWHGFLILCIVPIFFVAALLPRLVQSQQLASMFAWFVAGVWGFGFVLISVRYYRLRCPRCGRRFQFSWWHHHYWLGGMRVCQRAPG